MNQTLRACVCVAVNEAKKMELSSSSSRRISGIAVVAERVGERCCFSTLSVIGVRMDNFSTQDVDC